jgi:hypothetical protein
VHGVHMLLPGKPKLPLRIACQAQWLIVSRSHQARASGLRRSRIRQLIPALCKLALEFQSLQLLPPLPIQSSIAHCCTPSVDGIGQDLIHFIARSAPDDLRAKTPAVALVRKLEAPRFRHSSMLRIEPNWVNRWDGNACTSRGVQCLKRCWHGPRQKGVGAAPACARRGT